MGEVINNDLYEKIFYNMLLFEWNDDFIENLSKMGLGIVMFDILIIGVEFILNTKENHKIFMKSQSVFKVLQANRVRKSKIKVENMDDYKNIFSIKKKLEKERFMMIDFILPGFRMRLKKII